MAVDYIFCYGSLVNKESRHKTGGTILVGAARVAGLQRAWNIRITDKTGLGAVFAENSACNGVIVSVTAEELAKFDERELPELYKRVSLSPEQISFLGSEKPASGTFWVYIAKKSELADKENPILQSYLDVVLTGFLDFGQAFAEEFIRSTAGWKNIENDRARPRYSKHLDRTERQEEIDQLLKLI